MKFNIKKDWKIAIVIVLVVAFLGYNSANQELQGPPPEGEDNLNMNVIIILCGATMVWYFFFRKKRNPEPVFDAEDPNLFRDERLETLKKIEGHLAQIEKNLRR